ncbi:MAG: hypothetical protein IT353_12750 [Gemmatimonadaceae bacterium]|nr:hypothetical protein [Gemmatimonadaceae bacterium]
MQDPLGVVPDDHPLAPLIALAREKSPDERRHWFATLRAEAPTLVAQLEQLLGVCPDESAPPAVRPPVAPRAEGGGLVRSLLIAIITWSPWLT